MPEKPPIGNVSEFPLSEIKARETIVDMANHYSERIRFGSHVQQRMLERGVTTVEILSVLKSKNSQFTEAPHQTPKGSWKFNLRGCVGGKVTEVVVDLRKIETSPDAYVVTVFIH